MAILALDQGTTSSRAVLYGHDGSILAQAQRDLPQSFPRPGWVEHDARRIAEDQLAVAIEAVADTGLGLSDIEAVGITNQRETVVIWDRNSGEPIHPAIVWQDRRTAGRMDELRSAGAEDVVRSRTGLVLDPYFSASKIAWILDQDPRWRRRAEAGELAAGTIDCWLLWHLTDGSVHRTDVSNASRTALFDIHRGTWDDALCELWRVPRELLPEVGPTAGQPVEGRIDGITVPIAAQVGDQQAALFGQGCWQQGMGKCTYGTGAFPLITTGEDAVERADALTTIAWRLGDAPTVYALEGAVFTAGAAVQWLRDGLGMIEDSAAIEDLARQVPDSGGVMIVPAFTGLGTPHWDPRTRGTILGLGRDSDKPRIARAMLEGIAHSTTDALACLADGAPTELRVDGGAANNDLLMQLQADLLDCPVRRPTDIESTARGAAMLAAHGAGLMSLDELAAWWQEDAGFTPQHDDAWRQRQRERWQRAVRAARTWAAED